jgi:hypothetical protein
VSVGEPGGRLRLWLERAGDGFRIRDAGVSYRLDALQCDAFAPGRRLALVPEPDNEHDPNAIGIWDEGRAEQVGYVPAEVARELQAEEWQAVSLHEFFEEGRRCGLRVLLAPKDAWIGAPRA